MGNMMTARHKSCCQLDVDTYFSKRDYDKFIKSLDHVVAANDESGGDNDGNEHYGDENYFNRAA